MKAGHAVTIAAAVCGAMLAPAALAQSGAFSSFANVETRNHDGPRVMVYWQLPIDGGRARPASYGLRLDSAPLRAASLARLPLIDFRMQSQRAIVHLSGMPVARWSDSSDSSDSIGKWDSLTDPTTPGFWVGWTAAALVVSCLSENWPCKKNKSSGSGGYSPPG